MDLALANMNQVICIFDAIFSICIVAGMHPTLHTKRVREGDKNRAYHIFINASGCGCILCSAMYTPMFAENIQYSSTRPKKKHRQFVAKTQFKYEIRWNAVNYKKHVDLKKELADFNKYKNKCLKCTTHLRYHIGMKYTGVDSFAPIHTDTASELIL